MAESGFLEEKRDSAVAQRGEHQYVLSLIPYEETTTYKRGTRQGPEAIVDASGHIELLDETLRIDASECGILTVRPELTDLASITAHASGLFGEHPHALVGFLGGEHSVTPALIEGLGRRDIGVVWIDAHADLRRSFHGREDNHACAGYHSNRFGSIVQVGVRSLAQEEVDYLDAHDSVKCFRDWTGQVKAAMRALPDDVYMTIDLDGLRPELMRAVGTPEPGGLTWEAVLDILDFTFQHKNVCAFDVVELCPNDDDVVSSFTAARLVYKVMQYHAFYKLGLRPRQ